MAGSEPEHHDAVVLLLLAASELVAIADERRSLPSLPSAALIEVVQASGQNAELEAFPHLARGLGHHQRTEAFSLPARESGHALDVAGPERSAVDVAGPGHESRMGDDRAPVHSDDMPTTHSVVPVLRHEVALECSVEQRPDLGEQAQESTQRL